MTSSTDLTKTTTTPDPAALYTITAGGCAPRDAA